MSSEFINGSTTQKFFRIYFFQEFDNLAVSTIVKMVWIGNTKGQTLILMHISVIDVTT